jgi:membrane-associated phospholipid phosphatase
MYYLILICIFDYLMCIGKLAYHDPRPYMVNANIQVYDCSTEFGNPSGHAMASSSVFVAIFLDYWFSDSTTY